jgi:hypothetical protein
MGSVPSDYVRRMDAVKVSTTPLSAATSVVSALDELSSYVGGLSEQLEYLEKKLAPITLPDTNLTPEYSQDSISLHSSVFETIASLQRDISRLNYRVQSLRDRVEV